MGSWQEIAVGCDLKLASRFGYSKQPADFVSFETTKAREQIASSEGRKQGEPI
jgi:hypothetical protein